MAKKPNIRFNGFSKDWEEKRLGDMGETYNGLSGKSKEDFGHGEGHYVTYMNVFTNPIASLEGIASIEIDTTQNAVKKGDILFTTSSETPEEVGMSSVWLHDVPHTYLNSFCFGFRPKIEIDPNFSAFLMRSPKVRANFYKLAQGISRFNISKQKAMDIAFEIPSIDEQSKIGDFLKSLDDLISAEQDNLDKLRQMKVSLLSRLFPCGEENQPRIRFKGFTEPWEYVTLSEISNVKTGPFGSALHADDYVDNGIPIITTEHFKSGMLPCEKKGIPQVNEQDYDRLITYRLKVGDLVFSRVGSVDVNAHVYEAQDGWLFSGRALRVRPNKEIYPLFLHSRLETDNVKKDIIDRAVGLTMASINTEILGVTKILITRNYEEQTKIGNFFREQDELIDSSSKKITKLKRIRKALQRGMFVE